MFKCPIFYLNAYFYAKKLIFVYNNNKDKYNQWIELKHYIILNDSGWAKV